MPGSAESFHAVGRSSDIFSGAPRPFSNVNPRGVQFDAGAGRDLQFGGPSILSGAAMEPLFQDLTRNLSLPRYVISASSVADGELRKICGADRLAEHDKHRAIFVSWMGTIVRFFKER